MCISPTMVWVLRGPKYEQQPVACRNCWRCRQNRVNDYVGRCLAEAQTSHSTCVLTLTYAPRADLADKVLHPRHFQLFMKLLRRAGHKVRYLVAGEYGEEMGRAHFHAVLFFTKIVDPPPLSEGEVRDGVVLPRPRYNPSHIENPSSSERFSSLIPQKRMVHIREWPHGHVKADWTQSESAMRYVCKYLLKAEAGKRWFSLSKKPAIGAAWFAQRAALSVDLGVLPYTFSYIPPGGRKDRPYLMTGATRRDFLNAITVDPADRGRLSEWVKKTFDKHQRQRAIDLIESLPPEVQLQAISDRMAEIQAQKAGMMRGDEWRKLNWLEDLILNSPDGRVYFSEHGASENAS